jgi:hypothetical protein
MESSESTNLDGSSEMIKENTNYFIESTNSFFSGGIDLIKWTVAIASASVVWIATSIESQPYHHVFSDFLLISLGFFVLSIISAIFIVMFVLFYWANQMEKYSALIDVHTSPEFYKILGIPTNHEVAIADKKRSFSKAFKEIMRQTFFHTPKNFICLIFLHIVLLVFALISLICYIVF